jgi:hypothetical protein
MKCFLFVFFLNSKLILLKAQNAQEVHQGQSHNQQALVLQTKKNWAQITNPKNKETNQQTRVQTSHHHNTTTESKQGIQIQTKEMKQRQTQQQRVEENRCQQQNPKPTASP